MRIAIRRSGREYIDIDEATGLDEYGNDASDTLAKILDYDSGIDNDLDVRSAVKNLQEEFAEENWLTVTSEDGKTIYDGYYK